MAHHQQISINSALFLASVLWAATAAAQSDDCTNVLVSMSPCLNYISGNSSAAAPSAACCTQLSSVARSQPQCLCQVVNGGGSNLGLNINQNQALNLPKACNVQTPPASQCKAASPSGSSPNSGGGNSRTVPSSGNGSSDATSINLTASMLFFLVFTASYVSIFSQA